MDKLVERIFLIWWYPPGHPDAPWADIEGAVLVILMCLALFVFILDKIFTAIELRKEAKALKKDVDEENGEIIESSVDVEDGADIKK